MGDDAVRPQPSAETDYDPRATRGEATALKLKQDYLNELTDLLDQPRFTIPPNNGSSLPKYAFEAATRLAQVPYRSMPQAAEAVVTAAGFPYRQAYDSRQSQSGGGSTVTRDGLAALVEAVKALIHTEGVDLRWELETGQGRIHDPVRRKKIEDAAQDWLMQHYREHGFTVTDTRIGRPYDAVAEKGGAILYLEAKGTTSDGARVVVTRNEVAWARIHLGQCIMGIWSGIVFDSTGEVDLTQGYRELYYWHPEDGELEPIDYDWDVPIGKQLWPDLNYD